jgi:hypothetical protein
MGSYRYAEIMPYHNLGVGKSRVLGLKTDDNIPSGKEFIEYWTKILRESGAEVRVSGD